MRSGLIAALVLCASLLAPAGPARAQAVVNSETIDSVAVTLYRAPDGGRRPIDPNWPRGYALVTETRTIAVPAGPSVIRFQGVAQGMWPETAIVTGLPRPVREKNRDAQLISPAALLDAHLKRSVTIRRTNPATGRAVVEEALIEAGPAGGVVLRTAAGVEALGCSGLPESLGYGGVPDGLFAKPTLSVATDSPAAAKVTVQLSYLAEGFDWEANYVARTGDGAGTVRLFAWMTIANGGSQGFADAHTQAVAGQPNKEQAARRLASPPPQLRLRCWPMDITSTHPRKGLPLPPPPPPAAPPAPGAVDIVVTAQRRALEAHAAPVAVAMVAEQEQLGDLKLYRIPERVTVAARSRKQVAMIDRSKVRVERIYTATVNVNDWRSRDLIARAGLGAETLDGRESESNIRSVLRRAQKYADDVKPESRQSRIVLRTENRDAKGLGLPLPSGAVALFETADDRSLLVAEGRLDDRAVGDEVEIAAGFSPDVRYMIVRQPGDEKRERYTARITNARQTSAQFELVIPYELEGRGKGIAKRKGRNVWRTTVPANGEAGIAFALKTERSD